MRKSDNLCIGSVLALKPKTGELVWHYQFSPNDPYDYDATELGMLVDMDVEGKSRKLLVQANRNGFFYVLDRTDGKLLAANPYIKLNWADKVRPRDRPAGRSSQMSAKSPAVFRCWHPTSDRPHARPHGCPITPAHRRRPNAPGCHWARSKPVAPLSHRCACAGGARCQKVVGHAY